MKIPHEVLEAVTGLDLPKKAKLVDTRHPDDIMWTKEFAIAQAIKGNPFYMWIDETDAMTRLFEDSKDM